MANKFNVIGVSLCVFVSSAFFACRSPKELQYLQGAFDTTAVSKLVIPDLTVQKGDLLGIKVYSDNETASRPFNQQAYPIQNTQQGSSELTTSANTSQSQMYLVGTNGYINFPVVGALKVDGLTKAQLTDVLNGRLSRYLSNPYYDIKFESFKVTLIGEVTKPGVYTVPNERINILEAIGLAGDLTFFGKRQNVMVIRETDGKREFGRIDLGNPDLFKSPYYFLRQNDIVFVDMSKRKIAANDQIAFRNISLAATIVSAIAVLISVLR